MGEIMDGGLILRGGALTLPEEHPDGALLRLAKCVAAFVNLVPRRKKSEGVLVKSATILTKDMVIPVKRLGMLRKSAAILVKSKGTPTLSPIILLILLILLILSKILEAEKNCLRQPKE